MTFLKFDERYMLVNTLLNQRVTLMMFFHQHNQRRERHTKHFSELSWVYSILLSSKHTRFIFLYLSNLIYFLVTSDSLSLDSAFLLLITNIVSAIILPLVVHLLIDESVGLFKVLSDIGVDFIFSSHLQVNKFSD